MTWSLAERYDFAKRLAKEGRSAEEIMSLCNVPDEAAKRFVNRERPGTYSSLGKTELSEWAAKIRRGEV